ncbi:MAG: GtrA family protein [Acidobacteria bacterium]|nr:MAG: GtrA family protein [Acidobacteriota bacterium]
MRHSGIDSRRTAQRLGEVVRFALVGISNSLIDLGVTNILALLITARNEVSLLLISAVACATATLNSYFLNRRWTFRDADGNSVPGSVARFAVVASLSMVINTSVFLFLAKYLPTHLGLPELLAINVAKIGGIAAAMTVSFVGYRFGVFQTEEIKKFRRSFRFPSTDITSFSFQVGVMLAFAAAVRLGYLLLTTAVFGDAVNYSRVAGLLASGDFDEIDAFWSNLYSFWQAPFHLFGPGPVPATILASLVPGIALVVPVVWMARSLFGPRIAWLAGSLCAVHPRLVEYSCNGYAESFYLLAFTCATAFLMAVVRRGNLAAGIGWGVCFGVYAAVRPEAVAAFLVSALLAVAVAWWISRGRHSDAGDGPPALHWRRIFGAVAAGVLGFAVVVGGYAAVSRATLGAPAVLQKAGNLGKRFSEQLDWEQAARETYGANGKLLAPSEESPSLTATAEVLIRRFPRNLFYSMERMPGVLLSPVILFALLLPVFVSRAREDVGQDAVVGWMALFPILLYPLIQVEPRLFFSILVPVHIFGAAGLVAFTRYAGRRSGTEAMYRVLAIALVLSGIGLTAWRGAAVERSYSLHRQLASWIDDHVSDDEVLVGCGYGYISTTAFLTDNPAVARLWTNDATELAPFVRARSADWLLVYEGFLEQSNPELLEVLDSGIPGFELAFEAIDTSGRRGQVYELGSHRNWLLGASHSGAAESLSRVDAERIF